MKKSFYKKVIKANERAKNLGSQSRLFLTSKIRKAFTKLRQAFVEAPILNHFDLKRYIQIKIDVFGYANSGILSQLTLDDLGQWHPVAFFSKKKIPAKTWYKTHNGELLAIIEAFKTWKHNLESCKYEILMHTDYNNLQRFIDTKSLSFR